MHLLNFTYNLCFNKKINLGKIIEKLMANRLSYWGQTTDLLDQSQIGGRKNYSTLDEIIELIHEIQTTNQNKRIMFCLFLDIKKTFGYVNKKELLNIMNRTKIAKKLLKWTKDFMEKRKIQLNSMIFKTIYLM